MVGVCGPGDLTSSSHQQTVWKPEVLPVSSSDSNFGPCWDFAFSRASIRFVLLKHRSYSGLSLSTQISTDQATGAAIQISLLLLQPSPTSSLPSRSCPVTVCHAHCLGSKAKCRGACSVCAVLVLERFPKNNTLRRCPHFQLYLLNQIRALTNNTLCSRKAVTQHWHCPD